MKLVRRPELKWDTVLFDENWWLTEIGVVLLVKAEQQRLLDLPSERQFFGAQKLQTDPRTVCFAF